MFEYTGIRVRDLDASRRFYVAGLGLIPIGNGRTETGGRWERLQDPTSGLRLELNFYADQSPYREGDELDHLAWTTTELDALIHRLEALGGRLRLPPVEQSEGRVAFVADPNGVWIKLWQRSDPDVAPTSRAME
ncbi:MAG: VOC family protein [Thermoplasmata archaeon]|nr:VOC family protein [Thermoplasmata archaeon]